MVDHAFRFIVANGRVQTDGLASIGHYELAMAAQTTAEVEDARALLARLAAYVVSAATRLEAGQVLLVDDRKLALGRAAEGVLAVKIAGGT